jgi:sec-independent protein translocase protein TatA
MALYGLGLPSGQEWFWIFVVVFLLFGAKRLPELARGLGKAMVEFHRAKEEFERELRANSTEAPPGTVAKTDQPQADARDPGTPASKG